MLSKRLQEDDCNAGAIFDSLGSEYWPDEKFGIELICDAVPEQNVEVVVFTFNKEKLSSDDSQYAAADDQANETEVCTNYRYARRHDPNHMPKVEDKKDDLPEQESSLTKRSKIQTKKKDSKNNKKDPAQIEAEEKANKEAEEEQKLKESDAARKKAEEQARAGYRPKDFTAEEK